MQPTQKLVEEANARDMERLKARALAYHQDKIRAIKAFAEMQPDHPVTLANRHVLELSAADDSWNAAGLLSVSGFGWWALNLTADLAFPNYIIYNASGGPDWSLALFTSSVFGYFLTDPSKLRGTYNFRLQAVAGVAGEVSFDLYKTDGTQIASFLGIVLGLSISKMEGEGELTYH